jgi:hypothetical protein
MHSSARFNPAGRDRLLRRLLSVNRGGAIAAAVGVVGFAVIAAISSPGKPAASTSTAAPGGTTGQAATGVPIPAQLAPRQGRRRAAPPALSGPATAPTAVSGGGQVTTGGS